MALRQAARSLGQEGSAFSPPAGPMATELATLSRKLGAISAKLAQSRERERRIDQSRRQLVAWVSHDLRTPLAGLQAMAEALQDGIAKDPARYHKQIHAEATRLSGMVGVLMTVADGCGGIPEADLASVFDAGWRGSAARTPGADGAAGLGLAIVRGIVEAHHGQVSVVNAGDGCRFEIRLAALAPGDGAVSCWR